MPAGLSQKGVVMLLNNKTLKAMGEIQTRVTKNRCQEQLASKSQSQERPYHHAHTFKKLVKEVRKSSKNESRTAV